MIKKSFLIVLFVILSGCASRRADLSGAEYSQISALSKKAGHYKVGNPYKIKGRWYKPQEDYAYTEVGVASWYGEDFHAKYTANGEIYDMNTLTAAHRTLPLPSIVKVTNLQNGRSLILRVNDRGPFAKDRIIDISKRGAQILGFQQQGTTKVKVELLAEESKQLKAKMTGQPYKPTAVAKAEPIKPMRITFGQECDVEKPKKAAEKLPEVGKGELYVQAGAFASEDSAIKLQSQLQKYGKAHIFATQKDGQKLYRVRLGPFQRDIEANVMLDKVKYHGIYSAKVIKD